jgi:hypothetical protein
LFELFFFNLDPLFQIPATAIVALVAVLLAGMARGLNLPGVGHRLRRHPGLLLALFAAAITFPHWLYGASSYIVFTDTANANVAATLTLARQLEAGTLGLWNPMPLTGIDNRVFIFYGAETLLYTALPGWAAYGLITWVQRFIVGWGTYRLLRDSLRLTPFAALLGGLGTAAVFQFYFNGLSFAWLPVMLWALERLDTTSNRWRFVIAAALGLLYAITSYYFASVFLVGYALLWFALIARVRPRFWPVFAAFALAWLAPTLIYNVLPALPLIAQSHRADWDLRHPYFTLPQGGLADAPGLILRTLLTAPMLALVVPALVRGGARRRTLGLLLVGMIGIVLVSNYANLGLLAAAPAFSLGRTFQFVYMGMILPFLVPILAGIALSALDVERPALRVALAAAFVYPLIIVPGYLQLRVAFDGQAHGQTYSNFFENPLFTAIPALDPQTAPYRVATIHNGSIGVSSYLWSYGLETLDGNANVYPQRYQDYWLQVLARVPAPLTEIYRVAGQEVHLYNTGARARVGRVPALALDENFSTPLLSLANARYLISSYPLVGDGLQLRLWRSDADLTTIHRAPVFPDDPAQFAEATERAYFVYENTEAFPRFFVTGARLFESDASLLAALGTADAPALRAAAFLNHADVGDLPPIMGEGAVALHRYSADAIDLEVTAAGEAILVITNSYSSHWQATIDGEKAAIFPAYHAFQGLRLPPGAHTVALRYRPPNRFFSLRPLGA